MEKVAKIVGQHEMKVYEVATFYTMFNREKRGKHFIQLCGTTPCMVCGSEDIKKTIMDELGIKNGGETTRDEATISGGRSVGRGGGGRARPSSHEQAGGGAAIFLFSVFDVNPLETRLWPIRLG